MKPKQLANVLIRILGLSLIVHGIPSLINNIAAPLQISYTNHIPIFDDMGNASHYWKLVILNLIPIVGGIALIVGSRCLVEILFKDEAE